MSELGSDTGHGNLMFGCMLFYEPEAVEPPEPAAPIASTCSEA